MKKILLSTALLSATTGMAAAEVSFSGFGRFGLQYVEGRDVETDVSMRLRFNINGKVETDSGVTFGGRIRMQYTDGGGTQRFQNNVNEFTAGEATLSAAYVYATYEGIRLEVGNSNAAFDSAALIYNSEMGFLDSSAGDPIGDYYGFSTGAYGFGETNRMGIFASYAIGDFNVRVSYITPDQTTAAETPDEVSISADYKFGAITVSAASAVDAGGIVDNDKTALGAEYAINEAGNVGLLYFNDEISAGTQLITLYGNYAFDAITAKAYVAFSDDLDTEETETAYGIGADYDLGGARLSGSIHSNFDGLMSGDIGVRFDF